jgi:hypothetical protein
MISMPTPRKLQGMPPDSARRSRLLVTLIWLPQLLLAGVVGLGGIYALVSVVLERLVLS